MFFSSASVHLGAPPNPPPPHPPAVPRQAPAARPSVPCRRRRPENVFARCALALLSPFWRPLSPARPLSLAPALLGGPGPQARPREHQRGGRRRRRRYSSPSPSSSLFCVCASLLCASPSHPSFAPRAVCISLFHSFASEIVLSPRLMICARAKHHSYIHSSSPLPYHHRQPRENPQSFFLYFSFPATPTRTPPHTTPLYCPPLSPSSSCTFFHSQQQLPPRSPVLSAPHQSGVVGDV